MIHKTYVVNLARRTDKRMHMEHEFQKLAKQGINLNHVFFGAIDGRNKEVTSKYNFHIPNWADPTTGKALTEGEVGCALSHYSIWEDIVKTYENSEMEGEYNVLILEDDVIFVDDFMAKFKLYMSELTEVAGPTSGYDLIYMHRKPLNFDGETKLTEHIMSNIRKSYWACAYLLTYTGAKKCINAKYLENITPVDEFLPIMYGCYVNGFEKLYNIDKLTTYAVNPSLLRLTGNAFEESETYHTGSFLSASSISNADPVKIVYINTESQNPITDSLNRFKSYCDIYGNPYIIITTTVDSKKTNQEIVFAIEQVKSIVDKRTLVLILNNSHVIPMAPPSEILQKFHSLSGDNKDKVVVSVDRNAICAYVSALDFAIDNEENCIMDTNFEICRPVDRNASVAFKHTVSRVREDSDVHPCVLMGDKLVINRVENYTGNGWNEYYGFRMLTSDQKPVLKKVYLSVHLGENTDVLNILKRLDYSRELLTVRINYVNHSEPNDFTAINRDKITNIGSFSVHSYTSEEGLYQDDIQEFLKTDCEHYFFIDKTSIMNNPMVLKDLLSLNKSVVSPFIKKPNGVWSNFWGDIDIFGYYKRAPDYFDIVGGHRRGCWNVPYINGVYLIKRAVLEAHPKVFDKKNIDLDMRICAYLRDNDVFMYVTNMSNYGYIC